MAEDNFPTALPTRQKIEAVGRSRKGAVTGKLKHALDLMVWNGEHRDEAAAKAGLAVSSLRVALRKPHVLQHYNAELGALRTSLRARNLHRLDGIADNSKNDMAKVASIKAIEMIADQGDAQIRHPGNQQLPGLIIIVNNGTAAPRVIGPAEEPAPPLIDVTPQVITPFGPALSLDPSSDPN